MCIRDSDQQVLSAFARGRCDYHAENKEKQPHHSNAAFSQMCIRDRLYSVTFSTRHIAVSGLFWLFGLSVEDEL